MRRENSQRLLVAVASLAVLAACSTRAPSQTDVMRAASVDVSARRVRVGAINLARRFMATVELAADSIAALSDNPHVDYRTVVWKANALPAIQVAMNHPDPLVSYADGWVLLVQMRQRFESGGGRDLFGENQYVAIDALRELEAEVRSSVADLTGADPEGKVERFVYAWAESHPLTNDLFLRRSSGEAVADILGEVRGGGLRSLGSMEEMARDAQQMAIDLARYTPKQMAWQLELALAEMTDSTRVAPLLRSVDDMEVMLATAEFLRGAPGVIASERTALLLGLAEERRAILQDIDRQRAETLTEIAALLAGERAAILEALAAERAAIFDEIEALTAQVFVETRKTVTQLMTLVAITGLGLILLLGLVGRHRLKRKAA